MQYRQVFAYGGITLLSVICVSLGWEFVLKDLAMAQLGLRDAHITPNERWAFVATSAVSAAAAFGLSVILFRSHMLKQAHEIKALEASRIGLQSVFDNAPMEIVLKDTAGRYVMVNPKFEEVKNTTAEEIIGKTASNIYPDETAADVEAHDEAVVRNKSVIQRKIHGPRDEGFGDFVATKFPIIDAKGHVTGVGGISGDITERNRTDRLLRESEERYREMFETSPIGLWEEDWSSVKETIDKLRHQGVTDFEEFIQRDPDGARRLFSEIKFLDANQAAVEIYGAASKEQLLQVIHDRYQTQGLRAITWALARFANNKAISRDHYSTQRIDGSEFPIKMTAVIPEAYKETWKRVIVAIEDVSELKKAEADIAQERALSEAFLDNHPFPLGIKDLDGNYLRVNKKFEEVFGVSNAEVRGKGPYDILEPHVAAKFVRQDRVALETLVTIIDEFSMPTVSGDTHTYLTCKFPILGAQGKPIALGWVDTDISDLKLAEEKLSEAKLEAERANLSKTKFLMAASHDLRQPLYALNLFFDTLAGNITDSDNQDLIRHIRTSISSLGDAFSDLLDVSRLEAGTIRPKVTAFSAEELVTHLADEFSGPAHQKGLEFRVVSSSALVRSDPILLERALRNFLSNAVRYTQSGKILLGCRHGPNSLSIQVWDTGIGIPEDSLDQIFEEFHRLGSASAADTAGLGLGLAIVQQISRALGHRVRAISSPGKGSGFSIEVPYAEEASDWNAGSHSSKPVPQPQEPAGSLEGIRVLIIDDDAPVAEATAAWITRWGGEAIVAYGTEQALARIAELQAPPELALVDYLLGGEVTGIETLDRIQSATGWHLNAAIVTGLRTPEVVSLAEQRGYPCLEKPFSGARLRALCNHMLSQARGQNRESDPGLAN